MIHTINPYTKKSLNHYSFLTDEALNEQLKNCENSFAIWKKINLCKKEKLGKKLSELLIQKKEALAVLISNEMGKPLTEAINEIEKCADLVTYYTFNFKVFLEDRKIDKNTFISYQPNGAIFGIMPWNFPFWQVFRYAFPNIMAGNICILKHAPNTTGCGLAIEKLFLEAGFPKNVFTNITIDIPQVEQVIAHNITQGICVTGSTKAGSSVAALAGKYLKKSVLELGGSDASIFFEDADFKNALAVTLKARMLNAGQVCIAPKRIFIPERKLKKVIDFLTYKINQINLGDPLDSNTDMGPIAKPEFLALLENQVKKAIELGAQLICGGNVKTPFFKPTLLIVNGDNNILKDEIFGPVLCVIPYKDETNLLEQINNTNYGLGTAIWTKDIKKAKTWAANVETGYVSINKIVKSDVRYPFGGIKKSGYGKELGEAGFKSFLNAKTISL